jgi:hypothetical protein
LKSLYKNPNAGNLQFGVEKEFQRRSGFCYEPQLISPLTHSSKHSPCHISSVTQNYVSAAQPSQLHHTQTTNEANERRTKIRAAV